MFKYIFFTLLFFYSRINRVYLIIDKELREAEMYYLIRSDKAS